MNISHLERSWARELSHQINLPYIRKLEAFLKNEESLGKVIYPPSDLIFKAFKLTPFNRVKVIILGQDPYHGKNQAHGLSFSVQSGNKYPPSLKNIFKELATDLGVEHPIKENLENWASQGVLLLNNCLTVEEGIPRSHKAIGWEKFTSSVIDKLNKKKKNLVFILWGKDARLKGQNINKANHLIIEGPHPSPLSAYRGFLGSRPFSQTNSYLISNKLTAINWLA